MTKITSDMRRMVADPEFFAVVKALCEAQDMMRNYERKHASMRRQRYYDSAVAVGAVPDGSFLTPKRRTKPVPLTVRSHLDD